MSQMMERSAENSDEDGVSLKSNERTPKEGVVKETLGMLQTMRRSIRRAAEKSPLSSISKGTKLTFKADTDDCDSRTQPPPSPSLSTGSAVTSPLKSKGSFFQKKEDDDGDNISLKSRSLPRAWTDPNMARFGDSIIKRGASIRRSLRSTLKKDKDKTGKNEALGPVTEGAMVEDNKEELEEVKGEEFETEMEEMYTLPELPHTPLSVMQISKLIEMEVLEEAHLNLLALRLELQQEQEHSGENSMELAKKEKDLNLLYTDLRNKLNTIVRDSNSLPSRNKELLVLVSRIIQEEERRVEEPGGLSDSWMEAWREAVCEGVRVKVESVHLEQREQNASWLAVHLGLLGKAIVDDLENVRKQLRWSYPPSFKVFSTYVESYHRVVGQHLKKLEQQVTEQKDLYALLDWIINRYKSEKIMGSLSLQPDMEDESTELLLEEDFLTNLKSKYCCRVKNELRTSLDGVIGLENEEIWSQKTTPEKEDNYLHSKINMDIWTNVKGTVVNSGRIDAQLEKRVISSCLEELSLFPKRFETEFRQHCSALRPQPLWTEYQITYINSFTALQEHMEGYQTACPQEVEGFKREVKWLIVRLSQNLEDEFKEDVKPYLRRMMTRKWLTDDDDFKELSKRTEQLSKHCALMKPPHVQQELASRLHYHVVKEYIGQLMKSNYSCKNRKHEKAAKRIRKQWEDLKDMFEEMESTHEWLHHVGDDLCNIIEQKNKSDIKNYLQPLVEHYPDFSKKHLVAVLYFRDPMRGREHQLILQRLSELKKQSGTPVCNRDRALFTDMPVTIANTGCLSNLPFSCLSFLLPDN